MKRIHWLLFTPVAFLALITAGVFLLRPVRVDMASYAPVDSLLYMETNDPLTVVHALVASDAWKVVRPQSSSDFVKPNGWLRGFTRLTGIGSAESVMLSRAQVAVVVTNLGTAEDGDTLRVKPEFALIVETQTSEFRIRAVVENALQKLAESTYNKPTIRRTQVNGVEFLEWRNQEASRQIVATIVGSLVIVGNSEASVQRCLDSAGRRSPSLRDDANLHRLRSELTGNQSLAFGYVPSAKSAQLLSFAVPLILGRDPGDAGFQKVVSGAAAKLFGSIAWSSKAFQNGIEDRYLIALQPTVFRQLQPNFRLNPVPSARPIFPDEVYSVSYYRLENPLAAWEALRTSVTANTDALSAVVFSALMKSALLSYGPTEPEVFLKAVNGDIVTLRLDADGNQTIIIAGIKDRESLRTLLSKNMRAKPNQHNGSGEYFADAEDQIAAVMLGEMIVMGSPEGVRRYAATLAQSSVNEARLKRLTAYVPLESSGPILTYSDDRDRLRRFFEALNAADGSIPNRLVDLELSLGKLPYAATETKLVDEGLERTTRSPLGQFSTFLPLLIPEQRPTQPVR